MKLQAKLITHCSDSDTFKDLKMIPANNFALVTRNIHYRQLQDLHGTLLFFFNFSQQKEIKGTKITSKKNKKVTQ